LGYLLQSAIKIVLVETTHPGNIGAAARAMKNMGLSQLCLVSPKIFPSADATSRASGADDLLSSATVCGSLSEAISECQLVIGASARARSISWPTVNVRECADMIARAPNRSTAIVFGRENSGLTNAEIDRCHYRLSIPCNPEFSSLNLAAAVQVVTYELYTASAGPFLKEPELELLASTGQIESFYDQLYEVMSELGFIHPDKSRSIMRRLRRLFNRTHLEKKEIDILRGILSAVQGRKIPQK